MYESPLTEEEVTERRLLNQIVDEIHDRLRAGDLIAWGTPDNKKPHQKIKQEEWSDIALNADVRDLTSKPAQLHAIYRPKSSRGMAFAYVWIKFCRKQFLKEFPLAWIPRKAATGPLEKRLQDDNE